MHGPDEFARAMGLIALAKNDALTPTESANVLAVVRESCLSHAFDERLMAIVDRLTAPEPEPVVAPKAAAKKRA